MSGSGGRIRYGILRRVHPTVGFISTQVSEETRRKEDRAAERARRQQDLDAEEARRRHERAMAREARIWGPRADAYRQVLELLNRNMEIVRLTLPALITGRERPEPMPDSEVDRIDALVASFASAPVRELLKDLNLRQRAFHRAVVRFQEVQTDVAAGTPLAVVTADYGASPPDVHDALEKARDHYLEGVQRIRDAVAEELTADPD